jgi:hypothetical protein
MKLVDFGGKEFKLDQVVLRATSFRLHPILTKCVVTRIDNNKVYLDGSKVAIRELSRLYILEG